MANGSRAPVNRLKDVDKFAIVRVFEGEANIEFRGWAAAVKWVKDKTGIYCTKTNLAILRESAGLKFIVLKSRSGNGGNQWTRYAQRLDELEGRILNLERLASMRALSDRLSSGGLDEV